MIAESPSGYGVIFGDVLPPQTLAEIDPTCRQRQFGHVPMLWAWTAQVLDGNEACSRGLGYIQSWSAARGVPAPTGGTGAFCRARSRMSEEFIGECSRRVDAAMAGAVRDEDRWHGFTLKAIDGSSVKLMDTPENQEAFPQPSEQKPGCGFPVMSVSGLLNLSHGGWEDLMVGKLNDSDATLALGLMDHLGEGGLLGAMHESFLTEVGKPRRRASRLDMLIELASRRRIEPRPGRSEPRAVKRRPKPFALLTSPRHEFVEIPHRSNYRKTS